LVGDLHFNSFYFKIEERENGNKYACRLLSDSEPLGNNGDQLWVYTCQTDRESDLGLRGNMVGFALTMVGFCPINEHLAGSLIIWQIIE